MKFSSFKCLFIEVLQGYFYNAQVYASQFFLCRKLSA
jgi:hypothetical protein